MAGNTVEFPMSVSKTDVDSNEFDIGDFTPRLLTHPVLLSALNSHVRHCWIEFLLTNEVKPHVIFKFNFTEGYQVGGRNFVSCRLSMELHRDENGHQGPGACLLKVCSYTGRTARARAAFQFQVSRPWPLSEAINAICGTHRRLPDSMRSNLAVFHFVEIPHGGSPLYDGCRDWM
jgi:hypothetical protein